MKINFLTLFPKYYDAFINESIISKAVEKRLIEFNVVDWRQFSNNKQNSVDDTVYGGGAGMLLMVEPIDKALATVKGHKILISPQGKPYTQKDAHRLANLKEITFIAGRYEGFDERVNELVDEVISIGDYILTNGDIAAVVLADSIIRLVPNVIRDDSHKNDSFENEGYLDYPQYTKPREYKGMKVPEVLLNGNHKEIENWRRQQQIEKTKKIRPDIFERIKNEK
ncbi:tRNA (guanine-N(1)-)-methyltransferase [Mycoplasmopsis californica]|uniref:tRNA (guanine-N(1)-)-methyltransferase n=1 Tax=Mycoplasmopsis equigenitalium TaxID=114883 RepID=A0ABY5J2M7_9BACT|nr:tRNA (guanosine(37)-N1)-methyltransferase TrmD [Mycoplasmopsis equigenitalium]UUD37023.1 tRNA (guanosine(37)-N1)-methyltransferase TrmD [Mycoplasmopsis equigenitalium]VEU69678.1 tRNA (guanine-N(1)-)-methyltransferase [Mycoplasmopsis californica]